MRVVALVPARNEAGKVGLTVSALREAGSADQVIVIDDKSNDCTAAEAAAAGAQIVSLDKNLGKGGAVNRGLAAAGDFDIVMLIDADVGETAAEAAKLLAPVQAGEADMVVAVLPRREGTGGFGLALGLARWLIKRRGGFDATAPLSGQRALTKAAIEAAAPLATDYGLETAMTIDVLRAGLRVTEVPAAFTHSYTYRNAAGFRHRGRQYLDILKVMFRWPRAVNYAGRRIPTAVGAVFLLIPAAFILARFAGAVGAAGLAATLDGAGDALRLAAYAERVVGSLGLLVVVTGVLGLIDDVFGGGQARGFKGHVTALFRGRLTTGLIKAAGGGLAALAGAWYIALTPLSWQIIFNGLLIALAINTFNLLDLRPGRALKGFFVTLLLLLLMSSGSWLWSSPALWALVAVALLLLPFDIRAKMMLGDAGSNVLGAIIGLTAVVTLPVLPKAIVFAVFLLLNVVSERWSFSRIIAAAAPLRWFDELGRPR